jgi:glycine/D-amino acid oxidase-like deaminating enzyme
MADLEKYIRKHFNVSSVKYKWSSQCYIPVDELPYIGQQPFTAKGIYCATGFNGNGMMLGSVAAKILSDLIISGKIIYKDLFDPCRVKPLDNFKEFVTENAEWLIIW